MTSEPCRDTRTRSPGSSGFRAMLAVVGGRTDGKGKRDRGRIRLLFELALRRCKVCLELADVASQSTTTTAPSWPAKSPGSRRR